LSTLENRSKELMMSRRVWYSSNLVMVALAVAAASGCRDHMPHSFTWPAGGDVQQTHAKPPEGGYYTNWDPFAATLEVTPLEDVNPVRTQHVLVATVRDADGKALPNRRVEWILAEGSVGDIIEVDESGWRASRGYKVNSRYAVSHTNNGDHVLDRGTDDPSDDIYLERGQTWCVITSPIEGDTHVVAYAPGIYDWSKHKVFATKHWYDVDWEFPPPATNPVGTTHDFATVVTKHSDGSPLPGYEVTYRILDGPDGVFDPGGQRTATVKTDNNGVAQVTLRQTVPAEGTNNISIDIWRLGCGECDPAVHIAEGRTAKTWIGPKIACNKSAPASMLAGEQFAYRIDVSNPSEVPANDVMVTDVLPNGIAYVSSSPSAQVRGQTLTWNLGSISGGAQKTITIQVRATATGTFENCAEVEAAMDLSSRCCATTTVTSPELALDKTCTTTALLCDPIEYVLTVRNTGDGPATNVKVVDQLPDGIVTTDGQRSVTTNVGTLNAGQSREIRFMAKADRPGTFENTATASADGDLMATASCTTQVTRPVLEVDKSGPAMRYVGRNATFEITVTNTGDAPARGTVLTDPVPVGTTFVSANNNGQFADGTVTWNLGTIEPGASRNVALTVKCSQRGAFRNTATAKAYCTEASDSAPLSVEGVAAILLEVIDVDDPIEVGANETYVITVTNQGSAEDTNIVITCTLPAEMEYVSSDGPTRATLTGNVLRFAPVASLAPKAKLVYRVITKGIAEGDLRFRTVLDSDVISPAVEETESTHVY
jgi:uncharacterized repeat protein (TIGR01451 family)